MKTILICENSLEGIFTGIYEAYRRKLNHNDTGIQTEEEAEPQLFCEYVRVEPQEELFVKVRRTLIQRLGMEVYEEICQSMAVERAGIADAVYHTVVKGLGKGQNTGRYVLQDLADPYIHRVAMDSQKAGREICHLQGFLRFEELDGPEPVLYSKINPANNIVTFLAPHFADRFPCENFIIHDCVRELFVVHPKQSPWYVLMGGEEDLKLPRRSGQEERYRELFRSFCRSITIEGRRNAVLQRQMLPLRYRDFMVEFS